MSDEQQERKNETMTNLLKNVTLLRVSWLWTWQGKVWGKFRTVFYEVIQRPIVKRPTATLLRKEISFSLYKKHELDFIEEVLRSLNQSFLTKNIPVTVAWIPLRYIVILCCVWCIWLWLFVRQDLLVYAREDRQTYRQIYRETDTLVGRKGGTNEMELAYGFWKWDLKIKWMDGWIDRWVKKKKRNYGLDNEMQRGIELPQLSNKG